MIAIVILVGKLITAAFFGLGVVILCLAPIFGSLPSELCKTEEREAADRRRSPSGETNEETGGVAAVVI